MPCELCQDSQWVTEPVDGVDRAKRCACWRHSMAEHQLTHARIPRRYQHCELRNFEQMVDSLREAHRRATTFVEKFPAVDSLLLRGRHGVGKTHLAVAMLKEIVTTKGAREKGLEVFPVDFLITMYISTLLTFPFKVKVTFDGASHWS